MMLLLTKCMPNRFSFSYFLCHQNIFLCPHHIIHAFSGTATLKNKGCNYELKAHTMLTYHYLHRCHDWAYLHAHSISENSQKAWPAPQSDIQAKLKHFTGMLLQHSVQVMFRYVHSERVLNSRSIRFTGKVHGECLQCLACHVLKRYVWFERLTCVRRAQSSQRWRWKIWTSAAQHVASTNQGVSALWQSGAFSHVTFVSH